MARVVAADKNVVDGKVALITGGTSGIGAATARRMAELGAKVVVTGRRQREGRLLVDEIVTAWFPNRSRHGYLLTYSQPNSSIGSWPNNLDWRARRQRSGPVAKDELLNTLRHKQKMNGNSTRFG